MPIISRCSLYWGVCHSRFYVIVALVVVLHDAINIAGILIDYYNITCHTLLTCSVNVKVFLDVYHIPTPPTWCYCSKEWRTSSQCSPTSRIGARMARQSNTTHIYIYVFYSFHFWNLICVICRKLHQEKNKFRTFIQWIYF